MKAMREPVSNAAQQPGKSDLLEPRPCMSAGNVLDVLKTQACIEDSNAMMCMGPKPAQGLISFCQHVIHLKH